MRLFVALVTLCALTEGAAAESEDCKTITDPALRLTCYDKINPPVATYPIPLPKPTHPIPITRPTERSIIWAAQVRPARTTR
jgi:hypothetical protein